MWNKPTEKQLAILPAMYSTENIDVKDKVIQMHFFFGGSDWYATEYSPEKELFFGFVILNDDALNAEWGYFSLPEMCEINFQGVEIDRDLYWKACPAKDVEKISKALGWDL
jgi:hypothetical protein